MLERVYSAGMPALIVAAVVHSQPSGVTHTEYNAAAFLLVALSNIDKVSYATVGRSLWQDCMFKATTKPPYPTTREERMNLLTVLGQEARRGFHVQYFV